MAPYSSTMNEIDCSLSCTNADLKRFDPLLQDDDERASKRSSASKNRIRTHFSPTFAVASSTTTPEEDSRDGQCDTRVVASEEELVEDPRGTADQPSPMSAKIDINKIITSSSPFSLTHKSRTHGSHRKSKSMDANSPPTTNENGVFPYVAKQSSNSNLQKKMTLSTGRRKFSWHKIKQSKHRKSKSLNAVEIPFADINYEVSKVKTYVGVSKIPKAPLARPVLRTSSTTGSPAANSDHSLTSPMIQELWSLHIEQQKENQNVNEILSISNLTKPKATSFLTGREVLVHGQQDATKWQVEIPLKGEFEISCKLTKLLELQSKESCNLDWNHLVGCTRLDLSMFSTGISNRATAKIDPCHRQIVKSLLDCVSDIQGVRGLFTSSGRSALVIERQNQFICVFSGTNTEQQNNRTSSNQTEMVQLEGNDESRTVTVFADRCAALLELEAGVFGLLDTLTEENPFCDVAFYGHAFGAAMAVLASYRYALPRQVLRCTALVTATPKVGLDDFRLSAHSLSNLKVMRLEYGRMQSTPCTVGHCIRIHPSSGKVKAYKFGDGEELSGVRALFKRDKDIADYVRALEHLETSTQQLWVTDYYRRDGAGVRGHDNEEREMA